MEGELTLLLLVAERPARRESETETLIEAATEGMTRIKMPPAPTKTSEMMLREKRTTARTMATERMTEPEEDLRATKVPKISGHCSISNWRIHLFFKAAKIFLIKIQ